jgi:PAS domain S-box-containing protein
MCDNVPDMIWAKDTGKRYIFANRALCEKLLCASDSHEPLGKDDVYFANRERDSHSDNPEWHTFGELCQDSDQIILETLDTGRFEEKGNIRGELLILDVYKAPFRDDKGEIIGVVGYGRDITAQKLTEKELLATSIDLAAHMQELKAIEEELQFRVRQIEEQANYIKALFSDLPVPITYKDPSGRYLDCNPAFCEMWGVQKEDIINKEASHIFPHESKQFMEMDEKCKASKSPIHDIMSVNYNGIIKKLHVVKTLHMGDEATINGIITCMMEIAG